MMNFGSQYKTNTVIVKTACKGQS